MKELEEIEEAHRKENGKLRAEIEEKDKSLKLHTKLEYQYKNDYLNVIEDLKKKDKEINLMAEELVKAHEWFYSEFDNYTKEDFIKYFEKKAEEDK